MKNRVDSVRKSSVRERVSKHREMLRAKGLRPIQIWVPDIRQPGFAEECERQCLSLNGDPQEAEIMEWLDQMRDTTGWV